MLGWAHEALTRLNLNGHVSERNMTLDVVTLSVKGHTVLVVLSLMHVLFLGSERSHGHMKMCEDEYAAAQLAVNEH